MNLESALNRKYLKWTAIWVVWTLFGFFFASQVALQSQAPSLPLAATTANDSSNSSKTKIKIFTTETQRTEVFCG